MHGDNWNIYHVLDSERIGDRSLREHLMARGISWERATKENMDGADLLFFKGIIDLPPHPRRLFRSLKAEVMKRVLNKPFITLIGEPREHCRLSYLFSDREGTLCVAPDKELTRIFIPIDWREPHVEGWEQRKGHCCWIGRPMPDRVRAARELVNNGVELDIYSKQPWPLPCWKGFAIDDYQTSLGYKYRIVFENYPTHGYHSEKLFLSLRSGCVTFYRGDPRMVMPELRHLFVPYSLRKVIERDFDEKAMLRDVATFMRSDAWKTYSYEDFINTVIEKIYQRLDERERKHA